MLSNLSTRIMLSCLAPLIIISGVSMVIAYFNNDTQVSNQIQLESELIASTLMASGSQALAVDQPDFIDRKALEAITRRENIANIRWLTLDRKPFLDIDSKLHSSASKAAQLETIEYEVYYHPLDALDNFSADLQLDQTTDQPQPKEPVLVGYLQLAFDRNPMEANALRSLFYQLTLFTTIFLITLLLAAFNVHRISIGLRGLFGFIKQINLGDYSQRLPQEGKDELSALSRRLNALSQTLENNQEDIKQERSRLNDAIIELTKARNETEKANNWLKQMLGVLSHEMRTPLNSVVAPLELVLGKTHQAFSARLLENALSHVEEVLSQLDNVMDYTQLERGESVLEKSPTQVSTLIERVISNYQLQAEQKNLTLNCHYNGDPSLKDAFYNIDSQRLTQILINLISNAIKYSHQGEINLSWHIITFETKPFEIIIDLSDQGIGIPSDKLQDIFQMFHQVDSRVSRPYGGLGIGLAICKQYADLFKGQLSVRSQLNKGSTFTLQFPAEKVGPNREALPDIKKIDINVEQPISVLIVEDNIENSKVLCQLLKKVAPNVELTTIQDGQDALNLLSKNQYSFDIALVDVHLPVISGLEIMRKIRSHHANTRVIAVTADTSFDNQDACFDAGAVRFIKKPVRLLDIANIFQEKNKSSMENWKLD